VVPQVAVVVVAKNFNNNLIGVLRSEIEVFQTELFLPQSLSGISDSSVFMTSNDELTGSSYGVLELELEPIKLVLVLLELISCVVILNVVHGVQDEYRNVLRYICPVVATVHHSGVDGLVLEELTVTWLVIEPQIVNVWVVSRLLILEGGRVVILVVVVADGRENHRLGEVNLEHFR